MRKLILFFGILFCLSATFSCTPVAVENTENIGGETDGTGSTDEGTGYASSEEGTGGA